jgi:hypothetical protein
MRPLNLFAESIRDFDPAGYFIVRGLNEYGGGRNS